MTTRDNATEKRAATRHKDLLAWAALREAHNDVLAAHLDGRATWDAVIQLRTTRDIFAAQWGKRWRADWNRFGP